MGRGQAESDGEVLLARPDALTDKLNRQSYGGRDG